MLGIERKPFIVQRKPSDDDHNRGVTHRPSNRPPVSRMFLHLLTCRIPQNGHRISQPPDCVINETTIVDKFGKKHPALKVVPLAERPLNPAFKTHFGGGRAYGGGTSKEALRRARKKSRTR